MDKFLALLLVFVAGCTYLDNAGMNEWDYKMYQEGWELEYIDEDKKDLRWINGRDTGTNNSDT